MQQPQQQQRKQTIKEPCPWNIVEDVGGAFGMGLVGEPSPCPVRRPRQPDTPMPTPTGSSIWTVMHEPAKQPRGERFMGTIRYIKQHAPETGGRFALWGGTFAATNCTLEAIREKEDAWNKVGSGFVTGE